MRRQWQKLFLPLFLILALSFSAWANEERYVLRDKSPHKMQILNSGIGAFQKRLNMIERATKTIDLEYFIFNTDQASKLLVHKLIEKAKEGVKVRILIDSSAAVFKFKDLFATELSRLSNNNIEMRYYNRAPLIMIVTSQYRDHRKIFVVDGKEAIVGGRNIADEYFDNSNEYNFMDRDVWFEGPIVKGVVETFNDYWANKIVKKHKIVTKPTKEEYGLDDRDDFFQDEENLDDYKTDLYFYEKKIKKVNAFFTMSNEDKATLASYQDLGNQILKEETTGTCNDITFATDAPGKGKKSRFLKVGLKKMLAEIKHTLSIDSPYFVLKKKQRDVLKDLIEKDVKISLLTNSLKSTDAVYVAAIFNTIAPAWAQRGLDLYIHKGVPRPGQVFLREEIEEATWGTHSKSAVYDEKNFLVGTYNVDPRSKNINSESIVICRGNKDLAQAVLNNIHARREYPVGVKLDKKGKPLDGSRRLFNTSLMKKVLYFGTAIPAHLFKFLL